MLSEQCAFANDTITALSCINIVFFVAFNKINITNSCALIHFISKRYLLLSIFKFISMSINSMLFFYTGYQV